MSIHIDQSDSPVVDLPTDLPTSLPTGLPNARSTTLSDTHIYTLADSIQIFDGTTEQSRSEYGKKIKYLREAITGSEKLFSDLQPSTLTAQGIMTNIKFDEKSVIDMLSDPTGHILMIGCNYGEKFNKSYVVPVIVRTSGRGRKPKPKIKSRRKAQGNGKYFSSQITFLIEHPDLLDASQPDTLGNHAQYKIKLFRNGVFQVPGIRNPNMLDLVKPINILREYLAYNFAEDVQVTKFTAVMRNYKAHLLNDHYHVNLEKLEDIILREKNNPKYNQYLDYMISSLDPLAKSLIAPLISRFNNLHIAEMTYNTDRCFCLIIKFYRPSLFDNDKKTTVKLLKKGKINFDGGNSQQEIEELYAWLEYIYQTYKDKILFDVRNIKNEYASDTSSCDEDSIYDADIEHSDDIEHKLGDAIMDILRQPINKPRRQPRQRKKAEVPVEIRLPPKRGIPAGYVEPEEASEVSSDETTEVLFDETTEVPPDEPTDNSRTEPTNRPSTDKPI